MTNAQASPTAVLEVKDLHTHFFTKEGVVKAVNGVSFALEEGGILAMVGESGSGKSVTALSVMGLIPHPGRVVGGEAYFQGNNLLGMPLKELQEIRGKGIAVVFQDPQASLNPVMHVGAQIEEVLVARVHVPKSEARAMALALMKEMGLPTPEKVFRNYPYELSGGMCQRIMLAIALALKPKVLIADEPTSNLDTTLQADVLARLKALRREQHTAILLITHDMGVVARMADHVVVMYAGSVVESAPTTPLFHEPLHPYTWGLLQALPRIDRPSASLTPIRGSLPDATNLPRECPFLPRCPKALSICRMNPKPPLQEVDGNRWVACYNTVQHHWS